MNLKDYICEAISSGRTRSDETYGDTFFNILNLLADNGADLFLDFAKGVKHHPKKIIVSGDWSDMYGAPVIKLYVPKRDCEYHFELVFDGNKDLDEKTSNLVDIFAYRDMCSILINKTTKEKLDFIKNVVGIK